MNWNELVSLYSCCSPASKPRSVSDDVLTMPDCCVLVGVQCTDVMDRDIYRGNTPPTAVQAVVHSLPKDRKSRPSMGCPLPGRPINRNCPIVPYPAAMASDTPIMCLPPTEGESASPPFHVWTIWMLDVSWHSNSAYSGRFHDTLIEIVICDPVACQVARWMHKVSRKSTRRKRWWRSNWRPAAVGSGTLLHRVCSGAVHLWMNMSVFSVTMGRVKEMFKLRYWKQRGHATLGSWN